MPRVARPAWFWEWDESKTIPAEQLRHELAMRTHRAQWSDKEGQTREDHLEGITGSNFIAPSLELVLFLARETALGIKRNKGSKCRRRCERFVSDVWQHCNTWGGGMMSLGLINGNPIGTHATYHTENLVRCDDGQWWFIDSAYASSPDVNRFCHKLSPKARTLGHLEMVS
jgi:hypothetical protein